MGLHYSFVDDESYGTEDINNITGELTGAGIAPFPTKDSYSTSDLNGLTSALVGSGTLTAANAPTRRRAARLRSRRG